MVDVGSCVSLRMLQVWKHLAAAFLLTGHLALSHLLLYGILVTALIN